MTVVFYIVLVGVRLDVEYQRALVGEYLAAKFTLVLHWFQIMNLLMARQDVISGERLVANSTYVFLGEGMERMLRSHVSVELGVKKLLLQISQCIVYISK